MDAVAYLAERTRELDAWLDGWLPDADEPPAELHGAMRHLLWPAGKRLRPGLAFAAAEAVGAPPQRALPAAAAVELIHTYSLVHDDLPCMDDDDERRGRPTVHVAYDEATAVLAGDALLAAAFAALAEAPGPADPRLRVAALGEIARAAGSRHLVGGQVDDLAVQRGRAAGAAEIESIHRRKTGALITAAVVSGAALAGADGQALDRLRRFGECVGVAFQIADDRLDDPGGATEASSLVGALGGDGARERAEALLETALEAVEPFGAQAAAVRELARFAVWRDR